MRPLRDVALILALALLPTTLALCPYAQHTSNIEPNNPHTHHQSQTRNAIPAPSEEDKKGVFLMNRIAPGTSQLYISNSDGTNEQPLLRNPIYEYHATFSPDGHWISFTGERNGDGNSDIYRVRTDGSELQELVATPSIEDSVVISPDGKRAAYVSTANGYRANIWVLDLGSGERWNVTNTPFSPAANASLPEGYFRPAWSPDGEWLAFSSDRNTGWFGHGDPTYLGVSGWEHTQELSIYAIRPNGTGLRLLASREEWSLGSPKWSSDGKRVVFYEMTREDTWNAHRPESIDSANSSLVSVDFETGRDRRVEVEGAGVKIFPQYLGDDDKTIGYFYKGGTKEGIHTTAGGYINTTDSTSSVRSPSWSPDGTKIVYEKTTWSVRPMGKKLYSWDPDWEYRFTDVFPQLSNQNVLAITQKQLGNSSVVTMDPNGSHQHLAFNDMETSFVDSSMVSQGLAGAFNPSWSPDGQWITVGVGFWFQSRAESGGWIIRVPTNNASNYEVLTTSNSTLNNNTILNSGFPSFSPNGTQIVYRVWGTDSTTGNKAQLGLRLLDLPTGKTKTLTGHWDNLPSFSPDGSRIVFTRKVSSYNYDVCTIAPDGTDLRVLTSSGANDAHAVWTRDGRILYSTGMFGFQYECALYDQTFQPYGQVVVMDADGSGKRVLTDSIWEDSMPVFLPRDVF